MTKNIIIGVGNLLLCDDGIGIIAAKYLDMNFMFEPNISILDGGTTGLGLIDYFIDYDNVIIIDTISIDDKTGSIYKIPSRELLEGNTYKKTAHEVEVLQMLELCEIHGKKTNITVFGIVPKDISSVNIGLSKVLNSSFDKLIQAIIVSIKELDIIITKKANYTLDEIVKNLSGENRIKD